MARILIAGCGDVGTALGLNLVEAGHQVWGLKRNPATLPAALSGIAADLSQPGNADPAAARSSCCGLCGRSWWLQ